MPGPQFIHIQTWSRKANPAGQSISQIIGEVLRAPEYSMHVEDPAPPRIMIGNPETFQAEHDAHVAARSTVAHLKDGSKRIRSIRNDRHTMATIVMSYPVPRAAITTPDERAARARWERRNLAWLQETYGDQLRVVLAHDDEEYPHLHAWLLPDDPGADATTLHPGKVAKRRVEEQEKASGTPNREAVKSGNRALREAMTAFQDAYYQAVSVLEGLSRAGPRRRRLTRQQWQTEKAASLAIAVSLERASKANEQMAKIMMDRASLERDRASLDKDLASLEACSESVLRTIDRLEEVEAEQTLEKERLSKRAEALTETHDIASEFLRDLRKIAGLDWQKQRDIRDGLKELVEELKPKKPLSEHERIVRSIEAQMSHAGVKDPFKDAGPEV